MVSSYTSYKFPKTVGIGYLYQLCLGLLQFKHLMVVFLLEWTACRLSASLRGL